jgi:hypothetical protein
MYIQFLSPRFFVLFAITHIRGYVPKPTSDQDSLAVLQAFDTARFDPNVARATAAALESGWLSDLVATPAGASVTSADRRTPPSSHDGRRDGPRSPPRSPWAASEALRWLLLVALLVAQLELRLRLKLWLSA